MSEELIQRGLLNETEKIGKWDFYNIGATTVKALKENGIIRNVDYGIVEKKKVDGLIVQRKNVIAIIEYKKPAEFRTKIQQTKAINQEIEVAKKLGAKIIIATDTKETVWVNVLTGEKINDENGNEIKTNFNPKDEKIPELIEKINYSINETNNNLKPKQLVNPTDLARQIWQDIWSVSGATPENCLYTFVEIFIFKYLSDLKVLKGTHNFYTLVDMYEENTDDEVLEHYADTIRKKIKELFPYNPLDNTTIINGTIFVSKDQKAVRGYSRVFRKVLERFQRYEKLEHIDYDFKSRLFESFLKESISKKNWGQFFTPLKVVRSIVEMAKSDIKEGAKICDPACGVGKFLLEPIKDKINRFYKIENNEIKPTITIHGFDKGFDKDEQKTIILAKANMLIYFSDLIKENVGITDKFAELFNQSFTLKTNSILGTLSDPVENFYDLILTNPPYVTSGSSNLKEEIRKDGELNNYYKISAMGVEGLFMEWIIKSLKPNGKAYVVIPDGILNRQNDKNLRKYIIDECFIDGIISLPLNTFFTTNKKTYIFCLTKKNDKSQIQETPVFTYLVSEIGETRDVYRFDIDQNDLNEAVTLYSFFRGNKQEFAKINSDERCKIIPFNFFESSIEKNWIIDKLWTEDEKVNLGITEKNESVTLFEFSSIIEDVTNTIKDLQEEVKELAEKKKPKITYQSFKLKDLFHIQKGKSKYTKKYGDLNKGEFPVYSASNREALTTINTFDFDGEYLTWATNGFAGYIKILSGKFSINGDRGLLEPKDREINTHYIKHKLEPILRGIAKGRKGEKGEDEFTKVYPSMLENIEISMPLDESGNFDSNTQDETVEELRVINEINQRVEQYKKRIDELIIEVEEAVKYETLTLDKIFNIEKGKAKYTNKYIIENKGKFPVYSSQTSNNGVIGSINSYDYDAHCLTWTTDGIYAGTSFIRNGKFSMTTHCGALFLNEEVKNVSLEYIHYQLENTLRNFAEGDQNKRVTTNIIKKVPLKIPITPDGDFDLQTQIQIAKKTKVIEEIKSSIIQELDKILQIRIRID